MSCEAPSSHDSRLTKDGLGLICIHSMRLIEDSLGLTSIQRPQSDSIGGRKNRHMGEPCSIIGVGFSGPLLSLIEDGNGLRRCRWIGSGILVLYIQTSFYSAISVRLRLDVKGLRGCQRIGSSNVRFQSLSTMAIPQASAGRVWSQPSVAVSV